MADRPRMRTTAEVIEAARLGEPCTEEELRLCIVSMRHTAILAHMDLTRWAADESLPPLVRSKATAHWESVNTGWHIPLDQRVAPEDRPGHPSLMPRKAVADAVFKRARERAERRQRG